MKRFKNTFAGVQKDMTNEAHVGWEAEVPKTTLEIPKTCFDHVSLTVDKSCCHPTKLKRLRDRNIIFLKCIASKSAPSNIKFDIPKI